MSNDNLMILKLGESWSSSKLIDSSETEDEEIQQLAPTIDILSAANINWIKLEKINIPLFDRLKRGEPYEEFEDPLKRGPKELAAILLQFIKNEIGDRRISNAGITIVAQKAAKKFPKSLTKGT